MYALHFLNHRYRDKHEALFFGRGNKAGIDIKVSWVFSVRVYGWFVFLGGK